MVSTRKPYKGYRLLFAELIITLVIVVAMSQSVCATDDSTISDHVIQKAGKLRLYDDPVWLAIGHYQQNSKGWISTVADPRFFLSERGKTDPKAELEATIRAFFAPRVNIEEHATSRFVARLAWLRERGVLSEDELPSFHDTNYEKLLAEVRPTKILLAFPSPLAEGMNSAFGHVFLIFVHDDRSPLLAPSVSYAALIDKSRGVLYPILGLAGGFKAYYTTQTYTEKLKEYSAIDCRDMWEYELTLRPDEVERIFQHTWEMMHIYSWYYFLDENCSYGVLALLNTARPGLCSPAIDRRLFILPLDVIRQVREQGLVESTRYLPSVLTSMRTLAQKLSNSELVAAKAMACGKEDPMQVLKNTNSVTPATMLDVAMSLAQIRVATGEASVDEHQKIMGSLIRAVQNTQTESRSDDIPDVPPYPETAHLPSRLSTGVAIRNDTVYWLAGIRPAYHDFLDPSEAMDPAVQLQLMATEVLVDKTGDIAEWKLCLFDMETLRPCDTLYAPLSHRLKVSTIYRNEAISPSEWNCETEGGLGYSYALFERTLVYGMGEVDLQTRTLQGDTWMGVGPSGGFVTDLPWKARAFFKGRYQINSVDPDCLRFDLSAGYSIAVTKQMSIAIQYVKEMIIGEESDTELRLEGRLYF